MPATAKNQKRGESRMADPRRVVVTGIGFFSPIGNTPEDLIESMQKGLSGIRTMVEWKKIDGLRTHLAGVCEGVNKNEIPVKYLRKMGRVGQLACLATKKAILDSGLPEVDIQSGRCGVSYGSSAGSTHSQVDFFETYFEKKSLRGMRSSTYLHFMSHTCAANIAIMFHAQGPVVASSTACTSGSQGIGYGYEQVKYGMADIMLCGGAEEMHPMDAAIFDVMRATSTKYNDHPEMSPRPFDKDRDGMVVGEGAGTLVLEEFEHAKKRGANIHAELVGYGTNCDGHHVTNANPEGLKGAVFAALKDAGLSDGQIEYINAHATATKVGDLAESIATHSVFGNTVPISSLKGNMGHTLGAAGSLESIGTILMMKHGFLAPTLKLENPDPKCAPLNHILKEARDFKFDIGMTNNFAFGGLNTSIIFRKI